jgi:hypothetical protein
MNTTHHGGEECNPSWWCTHNPAQVRIWLNSLQLALTTCSSDSNTPTTTMTVTTSGRPMPTRTLSSPATANWLCCFDGTDNHVRQTRMTGRQETDGDDNDNGRMVMTMTTRRLGHRQLRTWMTTNDTTATTTAVRTWSSSLSSSTTTTLTLTTDESTTTVARTGSPTC